MLGGGNWTLDRLRCNLCEPRLGVPGLQITAYAKDPDQYPDGYNDTRDEVMSLELRFTNGTETAAGEKPPIAALNALTAICAKAGAKKHVDTDTLVESCNDYRPKRVTC